MSLDWEAQFAVTSCPKHAKECSCRQPPSPKLRILGSRRSEAPKDRLSSE